MATTNFDRYNLGDTIGGENVREDLTDVIYNISPTETPFQSNIGRGSANNTLKEWMIDELDDVNINNAAIDGADFGADASDPASRVGTYHQISIKYVSVSRRANIVNKAGRKSELAYQIAKKGKALRRDVEAIACNRQATRVGNGSNQPSHAAGLPCWIKTNSDRGTGGTDAALNGTGGRFGQPTNLPNEGTLRALSETDFLGVVRDAFIEGGNPNMAMMGPTVKQRFSNYMFGTSARIATQYQDQGKSASGGVSVIGAVDVYISDFSTLNIVPNRFQRERDVWVLDTEYWQMCYLDGYKTETIAKIGDSERRHILVDWCVVSQNEAASGVLADINSGLAMTS